MIVTVAGIDKHATFWNHIPNGIECDACGVRINWDRKDYAAEVADLKAAGWLIENLAQPTICPACVVLVDQVSNAGVAQR